MSHLTVVCVGGKSLRVVSARLANGGVEIVRSAEAPLPEGLAERPAGERAPALREALAKCGGGDGRSVVVIPRSQAILKDFELPAGSPEEVHQMLRFQVGQELPLPLDQVRYSYVEAPAAEGRLRISVAAVPKEQIDALTAALEAAGCRVQGAYVSSFGLASLLPADAPLEGASALVGFADDTAEILVVDGGVLAFSRSAPMREAGPDALATEVERTLLSYAAKAIGREVKRVIVAGEDDDAKELAQALKKRLAMSVDALVLNGSISRRAGVTVSLDAAAAAGVCVGALRGHPAMPNVLRPPVLQKRFRLKRSHRIGILAGVVAVALFAWSQIALSDRRAELESLRRELKEIEPEALKVTQTRERTKLAAQWLDGRYAWIDTFDGLQQKIDRSKLWLTSCVVEETGSMRLQGKAADDDHVSALIAQLQKVPAFKKVDPEFTRPSRGGSGYKFDFAIKIQLAGLAPPKKR